MVAMNSVARANVADYTTVHLALIRFALSLVSGCVVAPWRGLADLALNSTRWRVDQRRSMEWTGHVFRHSLLSRARCCVRATRTAGVRKISE